MESYKASWKFVVVTSVIGRLRRNKGLVRLKCLRCVHTAPNESR